MKPAKERLVLSSLTPEQLKAVKPKQFGESQEYSVWKRGIVRRRLKLIDQLLSTGEWISNTRMMEEINELYLDAPNEDCYKEPTPPHRLIESREGGRKRFESALSLMFAGTIRQDRFALNNILRIVGKEHIFEKKDGEGIEGWYRYNTKYSIFEKYTINDIEFDDYELANSIPIVLDTIKSELKTEALGTEKKKDLYLVEVANNLKDLTMSTLSSVNLLSSLSQARKRAQVYNNNQIRILLDRGYIICIEKKDDWVKELYKITKNIYYLASHPDADVDIESLFSYRFTFAFLRIFNEPDYVVLDVMREAQEDLKRPELASLIPNHEDTITAVIKHFVFELVDYNGMSLELEKHYQECICSNSIIEDFGLMEAIHSYIFRDLFLYPERHQQHERFNNCLGKLIDLYLAYKERDSYVSWTLLLFIYCKRFSGTAEDVKTYSRFEQIKLNHKLLSAIGQNPVTELMRENAHKVKYFQLVIDLDFDEKNQTVEYLVLTEIVLDIFDYLAELILAKEDEAVEPLPSQETLSLLEMLLMRISKLKLIDIVHDRPVDSPLLKCNVALAMLHDIDENGREALSYYHAAKDVYEKDHIDLPELIDFVSYRINALSQCTG